MDIKPKDEVWFMYNNRIQKGTVLQEEEHGIEGWYSLFRVQIKYGSQIIEDYRLFGSKDELISNISEV